jgi:hypothetical protein
MSEQKVTEKKSPTPSPSKRKNYYAERRTAFLAEREAKGIVVKMGRPVKYHTDEEYRTACREAQRKFKEKQKIMKRQLPQQQPIAV